MSDLVELTSSELLASLEQQDRDIRIENNKATKGRVERKLTTRYPNIPESVQQGRFPNIRHAYDKDIKFRSMRILPGYI